MSDICVLAIEVEDAYRAVTLRELQGFENVWSVDSRLIRDLEGVCGATGLDMPVSRVMERLGNPVLLPIPVPRILGRDEEALTTQREISKIRLYPGERSHRIDLCWRREKPGRWVRVPRQFFERNPRGPDIVLITADPTVGSECPDYQVIYWRR